MGKAEAEGDRAKLLGSTNLGEKLSVLEVYGEMVKKSNEGVKKVVYVDPSTTQAGNPFGSVALLCERPEQIWFAGRISWSFKSCTHSDGPRCNLVAASAR